MSSSPANGWNWEWPPAGPTPVHQGLDSEMFDRTDFPYTDTLVREAIQNSLDARLDENKPVIISFHFHIDKIGPRRAFLQQLIEHRMATDLKIPDDWGSDKINWLVVEDFHSTGLRGSLKKRKDDFWGYWLNFGVTNKSGTGRGGRGIGRVTFLIASQIQSVIGYTRRRKEDVKVAACGMAALRADEIDGKMRSTHAYLAPEACDDVYRLYDSPEFQNEMQRAFSFEGYDGEYRSGLGLAILYPHDDLKENRILAAAIEHFAPAIINNDLMIQVGQTTLNSVSIDEIAHDVAFNFHDSKFRDAAINEDVSKYLSFIRQAAKQQKLACTIELPSPNANILQKWGEENQGLVEYLREKIKSAPVTLDIVFPLNRNGKAEKVNLWSVVGVCPSGRKPINKFFRRGMCLPDVKDKSTGALDIVTLVQRDGQLSTYLNFCEGKAHLDLLESNEVRQKLRDGGFDDGYKIKRLVKNLPVELRKLLMADISEPNPRIFEKYFAKPKKMTNGEDTPVHPIPPNPDSMNEFDVKKIKEDGICIIAKSEFADWPVTATITLAYANGSHRPSWSPHDFRLEDLKISAVNCDLQTNENIVTATKCGEQSKIWISGFDRNREIDVAIKTESTEDA